MESAAHRAALLEWLDELDEKHGKATPEEQAEVEAFLDEAFGPADSDADERAGAA